MVGICKCLTISKNRCWLIFWFWTGCSEARQKFHYIHMWMGEVRGSLALSREERQHMYILLILSTIVVALGERILLANKLVDSRERVSWLIVEHSIIWGSPLNCESRFSGPLFLIGEMGGWFIIFSTIFLTLGNIGLVGRASSCAHLALPQIKNPVWRHLRNNLERKYQSFWHPLLIRYVGGYKMCHMVPWLGTSYR